MTEEQARKEGPPSQPPPAPPPAGGAELPPRPEPPARAKLMDWQGPAFWMSCGALLAGLAGGAVVLAQRVGVERDLMAVATTLPQAAATPPSAPAPASASEKKADVAVMEGSSTERAAAPPAVRAPKMKATTVKARPRKKTAARRKAVAEPASYAEVFKRCPTAGQAGAVQCRRDICNGAEKDGPACRPYRPKLR